MKTLYFLYFWFSTIIMYGQWPVFYPLDSSDFESPSNLIIIDTSIVGNLWQIGEPDKLIFNEALSPINALMTDTAISYPIRTNSVFYLNLPHDTMVEVSSYYFSFYHRFDTDSAFDYGHIEASIDSGLTWFPIDTNFFDQYGRYYQFQWESGALPNGDITGQNGDDWVFTRGVWIFYMLVKSDFSWCFQPQDLKVRFSFVTDSICAPHEGWMIDNLEVGYSDLGGKIENQSFIQIQGYPNPANEIFTIDLPISTGQIEVYNLMGCKIISKNIVDYKTSIDISELNAGVYFWRTNNVLENAYKGTINILR